MLIISHRGNLYGPNSCKENHPVSIERALLYNFDCEVDVWKIDNKFFLGHDCPEYEIKREFLLQGGLWIHCKNLDALIDLRESANAFFHDRDDYTLTSKNIIWVYPGKKAIKDCVLVNNTQSDLPKDIYGVCTDWAEWHKKSIGECE
jgi:hypothetical protein